MIATMAEVYRFQWLESVKHLSLFILFYKPFQHEAFWKTSRVKKKKRKKKIVP